MLTEKPAWLIKKILPGPNREKVEEIVKGLSLHTVCEQACCPNIGECFSNKTATFLLLGNLCSRNCTFCQVLKGKPQPVDASEPANVANAVAQLKLKHVVVTSVTRDDLPDGGSRHFAQVIKAIQTHCPQTTIEVLIPDFQGSFESLQHVIAAKPTIINHNIETIERLYPQIRPMADYTRSLELLKRVKSVDPAIKTKSGIMVGFGEKYHEVVKVMQDLRLAGCNFLTIGQYLAPSKLHHPVIEYVHPDTFEKLKHDAEKLEFRYTASGPFVRSSYHAGEALQWME